MDDAVAVSKGFSVVPWQVHHIALESILQDPIHLVNRFVPVFGKDLLGHYDGVAALHNIATVQN